MDGLNTIIDRLGKKMGYDPTKNYPVKEDDGSIEHFQNQANMRRRADAKAKVVPVRFTDATMGAIGSPEIHAFVSGFPERGLYLYGDVGRGKTYASAAVVNYMIDNDLVHRVMWANTADYLIRMKETFGGVSGSHLPVLADFSGAQLTILDDLGVENPTEWAQEQITVLVNAIYESGACPIISSNLDLKELARRLGPRTASRVIEMCDPVHFDGPNLRIQHAKQRRGDRP